MKTDMRCSGYSMPALDAEAETRCPACEAPVQPLYADHKDNYFLCRRCCLLRVWPAPTEEALKSYYADSYEVDHENYIRGVERNGERLLAILTRQSSVGRLLEIGCSWGGFLAFAKLRGWNVAGVELSPEPARWAREHEALNVHLGTLASSPFVGCEQFDVVAAWHVIEHFIDPLEFLRQAHSCLRPGGILALRTPNVASLVARMNGRTWEWFGAPAHLTLFSPQGLARLTERAGFHIENIRTRRGDARNPWLEMVRGTLMGVGAGKRIKGILGWEEGNSELVRGASHFRRKQRIRLLGRLDRLADGGLFFLYPVELLLNLLGRGPEILLLARRTK